MTRETIEIMAALADERKIAKLDRALRYRFSTPYSKIPAEELRENYAYNVIAAALDYCLDECKIIEMNMVKTYYRSEYSDKQWRALIDTAAELGCQVTYGKYGDRAVIDSTDRENALVNGKENTRATWAEHIHKMLQDSIDLRTWKVQPKRYHKGYCPIICKSQKSAEHEQERLERITGFEWTITVIPE